MCWVVQPKCWRPSDQVTAFRFLFPVSCCSFPVVWTLRSTGQCGDTGPPRGRAPRSLDRRAALAARVPEHEERVVVGDVRAARLRARGAEVQAVQRLARRADRLARRLEVLLE